FHAQDSIPDFHVTGVQPCALPIFAPFPPLVTDPQPSGPIVKILKGDLSLAPPSSIAPGSGLARIFVFRRAGHAGLPGLSRRICRSEGRRVGLERSRRR